MRARPFVSSVLTVCVFLGARAEALAATWVEVRSSHFTILSDAGEKRARSIAWQFEQIRGVLGRLWPWATLDFDVPVVVYAARDEASMRQLVPQYFEGRGAVRPSGVFVSAADAHYVTLRTDLDTGGAPDVNPYLSSYWSYVSLVLRSSVEQDLPPWLLRGLAEMFGNTVVREKEIRAGLIIPWNLQRLREVPRLPLDVVLSADAQSPQLADGERMRTFDATAWALVHYLIFGNQAKNLATFNTYMTAVRRGAPPAETLLELYGGAAAIRDGLSRYIDQSLFVFQRIGIVVDIDQSAFAWRQLKPEEAALVLARLHVAMRRPQEARAHLAAARNLAAAAEVEGMLFEQEKKKDEARSAYARASQAGAASFFGEYRLAVLSWPEGESPGDETLAAMETSLRRSVELNPRFAPAHALLKHAAAAKRRADDARARENAAQRARACMEGNDAACREALAALEDACKAKNQQACLMTAFFYSEGRGVARDEDRAMAILEPLCAEGNAAACMPMGTMMLRRGGTANRARGRELLEKSCKGGVQEACKLLSSLQ